MKRAIIHRPELKKFFAFEGRYHNFSNNLAYNSQIFNPFSLMTTASLFCFVAGFKQSIFWAVGFGLISILFYLYFKTLRVCQGVMLERLTKNSAREKETLEIKYRISNATTFSFPSIYLEEVFDGVAEHRFGVEIKEVKPGLSKR